jgi:uncharacterized protein with PIN domain
MIDLSFDETAELIAEITAQIDSEDYTFIDEEPRCIECNGALRPLGTLGTLDHYRCESCGLNHSEEHRS